MPQEEPLDEGNRRKEQELVMRKEEWRGYDDIQRARIRRCKELPAQIEEARRMGQHDFADSLEAELHGLESQIKADALDKKSVEEAILDENTPKEPSL